MLEKTTLSSSPLKRTILHYSIDIPDVDFALVMHLLFECGITDYKLAPLASGFNLRYCEPEHKKKRLIDELKRFGLLLDLTQPRTSVSLKIV